jgi:hypothetical protein
MLPLVSGSLLQVFLGVILLMSALKIADKHHAHEPAAKNA